MFIIKNRILFVTTYLIVSIQLLYSQEKDSVPSFSKNTIYVNTTTKGALYSVNYDRVFYKTDKLTYSYNFGISILEDAVATPVGINLFTGKENSHLEFSFIIMPYIDKYKSFLSKNDLSDKYIYIVPGIGYRYQKLKGGLFFKLTLSPMLVLDPRSSNFWKMDPELFATVNISLGFSF